LGHYHKTVGMDWFIFFVFVATTFLLIALIKFLHDDSEFEPSQEIHDNIAEGSGLKVETNPVTPKQLPTENPNSTEITTTRLDNSLNHRPIQSPANIESTPHIGVADVPQKIEAHHLDQGKNPSQTAVRSHVTDVRRPVAEVTRRSKVVETHPHNEAATPPGKLPTVTSMQTRVTHSPKSPNRDNGEPLKHKSNIQHEVEHNQQSTVQYILGDDSTISNEEPDHAISPHTPQKNDVLVEETRENEQVFSQSPVSKTPLIHHMFSNGVNHTLFSSQYDEYNWNWAIRKYPTTKTALVHTEPCLDVAGYNYVIDFEFHLTGNQNAFVGIVQNIEYDKNLLNDDSIQSGIFGNTMGISKSRTGLTFKRYEVNQGYSEYGIQCEDTKLFTLRLEIMDGLCNAGIYTRHPSGQLSEIRLEDDLLDCEGCLSIDPAVNKSSDTEMEEGFKLMVANISQSFSSVYLNCRIKASKRLNGY